MPIIRADRLTRIGAALLRAAGASDEEATWDRLRALAGEYQVATELDRA